MLILTPFKLTSSDRKGWWLLSFAASIEQAKICMPMFRTYALLNQHDAKALQPTCCILLFYQPNLMVRVGI